MGKGAYPIGGVRPSPFSTRLLLICSFEFDPISIWRAAAPQPAFQSTKMHEAKPNARADQPP
ncbi:hypothetical protein FCV25MIE_07989, partial [Fagus crenata]